MLIDMKTPTVFILYDEPLFAHGLGCLLHQESHVEVVGMAMKDEEALCQVRTLKPDAILVEAETQGSDSGMLLSRLIQDQPEVSVVSVSLSGNDAVLYTGRRVVANGVQDLIRAIGDPGGS
jgi:DNA-binding NarL/FixJ family response regulator